MATRHSPYWTLRTLADSPSSPAREGHTTIHQHAYKHRSRLSHRTWWWRRLFCRHLIRTYKISSSAARYSRSEPQGISSIHPASPPPSILFSPLHGHAEGPEEPHPLRAVVLEKAQQPGQVLRELTLDGSLVAHEHAVPESAPDLKR